MALSPVFRATLIEQLVEFAKASSPEVRVASLWLGGKDSAPEVSMMTARSARDYIVDRGSAPDLQHLLQNHLRGAFVGLKSSVTVQDVRTGYVTATPALFDERIFNSSMQPVIDQTGSLAVGPSEREHLQWMEAAIGVSVKRVSLMHQSNRVGINMQLLDTTLQHLHALRNGQSPCLGGQPKSYSGQASKIRASFEFLKTSTPALPNEQHWDRMDRIALSACKQGCALYGFEVREQYVGQAITTSLVNSSLEWRFQTIQSDLPRLTELDVHALSERYLDRHSGDLIPLKTLLRPSESRWLQQFDSHAKVIPSNQVEQSVAESEEFGL